MQLLPEKLHGYTSNVVARIIFKSSLELSTSNYAP